MATLTLAPYGATVTWLGRVANRARGVRSVSVEALELTFAGPAGEAHAGLTRPACVRVAALHPKGTEIRNVRQLSILSAEELAEVAAAMGLDAFDPGWAGATMVVSGIPDFTHLPPSSRLQAPSGATLVVDMENLPCRLPAKPIEADRPGYGARFRAAAEGRRGVTAWVEREGTIRLGDRLRLFVPAQRPWAP